MNYLNYLKSILGDHFTITDELNYNYSGKGHTMIIKELAGSIYRDSVVKTIQLAIYTVDVPTAKALLDTFTKTYNNTSYVDDFDYVRQIYSTPMVLATFNPMGDNYTSQLIVTGTLIISSNVSSIKQVFIDGVEYETSQRLLLYKATQHSDRVDTESLNRTNMSRAGLQFTCQKVSKNDALGQKLRNIRKGTLNIDTSFTIKLVFSENDFEESYTMKCDSATISEENINLPVLSLSFTL